METVATGAYRLPGEHSERDHFMRCVQFEAWHKLLPQLEPNTKYTISITAYWTQDQDDDSYTPKLYERYTYRISAKPIN